MRCVVLRFGINQIINCWNKRRKILNWKTITYGMSMSIIPAHFSSTPIRRDLRLFRLIVSYSPGSYMPPHICRVNYPHIVTKFNDLSEGNKQRMRMRMRMKWNRTELPTISLISYKTLCYNNLEKPCLCRRSLNIYIYYYVISVLPRKIKFLAFKFRWQLDIYRFTSYFDIYRLTALDTAAHTSLWHL